MYHCLYQFYLPPLPSIRPNPVNTQIPFPSSSSALHRYRQQHHSFRHNNSELVYSHRDGLRGRGEDLWARVKRDKQGLNEEDLLERAISRRKEIYRFGLYAKVRAFGTCDCCQVAVVLMRFSLLSILRVIRLRGSSRRLRLVNSQQIGKRSR